ncbi:MAG: type II secretion system protein [Candidatus Omnitrophota bacterium]|nr:type II secretion system protein [Candidatus Omnitrophota bacterium]
MLKPKNLRSNKGYLLLEAVASIAVIAIGLAVILRSFTSSLRASKISQEYFIATSLLNDNICDLEGKIKIKKGQEELVELYVKEKEGPEDRYSLDINPAEIDGVDSLAKVNAVISWDNGNRKEKIEAGTFLRYKKGAP